MGFPQISNYKGQGSSRLNRGLMKKKHSDDINKQETLLNKELSMLGNHEHTELYGHDGITNIPYEILTLWYKKRIGKIIMFPNFLSTSLYKWKDHVTIYKIKPIKNSRGKDLSEAIGENGEKEVLYKSKTKFRIENVGSFIELSEYDGNKLHETLYESIYLNDPVIKEKLDKTNHNSNRNSITS